MLRVRNIVNEGIHIDGGITGNILNNLDHLEDGRRRTIAVESPISTKCNLQQESYIPQVT